MLKNTLKLKLNLVFFALIILIVNMVIFANIIYQHISAEIKDTRDLSYQVVETARSTQVHFKKQVQEWKNILLRGHIQADYEKYLHQFMNESQLTQDEAKRLLTLLNDNPPIQKIARQFFVIHEQLMARYSLALEKFNPQESNSYITVDKQVIGIDREPTDLLDSLIDEIHKYQTIKLTELNQHLVDDFIIFLLFSLVLLITSSMILSWLINRLMTKPLLKAIKIASQIAGENGNASMVKANNEVEQLFLTLKAANSATKAKSVFLDNMSHELRTPMHGILSYANLGINYPNRLTPEKTLQYFNNIKISADRLMCLLNDILNLAKLESGKMEMSNTQSSLQNIVNNCISEQQTRLTKSKISIAWHTDSISGEGVFDTTRIAQVVTNYLSNAIKFTPEGQTIELLIANDTLDDSKGDSAPALLFRIRDHGKGIPDGECELIFNKFTQGSDSVTGTTKSTGLGLPICKQIIIAHSGKLWAENHPDGGAIFSFIIPVEQVEKPKRRHDD